MDASIRKGKEPKKSLIIDSDTSKIRIEKNGIKVHAAYIYIYICVYISINIIPTKLTSTLIKLICLMQ